VLCSTVTAGAQTETRTADRSDAVWSVEKLKTIESAIQSVAKKNTDACVGIDDGYGVGSGVIVSRDGLILTAAHVMSTDQTLYEIFFSDGTTAMARRLGRNLDCDAGMLQLEGSRDWPHVELGTSDSLKKGDWVVSLGHSGGFELGRNPPVRSGRFLSRNKHLIVTDAVLIGGDSGGPLFDLEGRLIAIHSSIGDSVSINRHAKIEQFKLDWDRLRRGETWGELSDLAVEPPVGKAKMGVKLDLTSARAKIKLIKPRSAAAKIGLAPNDIVIGLDGEIITDAQHLIRAVKKHIPGETCFLTVLRGEQTLQFEIRLD
jgi:serine protease Do